MTKYTKESFKRVFLHVPKEPLKMDKYRLNPHVDTKEKEKTLSLIRRVSVVSAP